MTKTFGKMVEEALAQVKVIGPAETQSRLRAQPDTLVIDVRDAADIVPTGTIPKAVNISYGSLIYKADTEVPVEWRDPRLQDRSRPIITTCIAGPLGVLAGKLLEDMGFNNVLVLDGGVQAWKDAGFPTAPPGTP